MISINITKNILLCRQYFKMKYWFLKSLTRQLSLQTVENPFEENLKVSEIIDVRTSAEYEIDHIPGAVNLPVLNNEERITVGTLYTKDVFSARKTGAAAVTRNISEHLQSYFSNKSQDYSPLVYCWRGGMRSNSMGIVLSNIGFQAYVLKGGYKAYRNQVVQDLKILPDNLDFRVITGLTGSGKTYILQRLRDQGEQVLDLEGLAKHRGSVLGLWYKEEQPSQKLFESFLRRDLASFSPGRPVWLESESRSIGCIEIPSNLFEKMCRAERFKINVPLDERVTYSIRTYPHWCHEPEALKNTLSKLLKYHGLQKINLWMELIDKRKWEDLVRELLINHYDPAYTNSQRKNNRMLKPCEEIDMPDFSEKSVSNVIDHLKCSVIK
ncbi:hypothetical protein CHS0354_011079 [Potamilus streckersoni]|uniref:Rhodanese domain-containing protein n=1 Tax=Potamilus streckersoni TaxID=2493646 RepID=A0AAE0WEJ2_9BIVA|nr:hypothetical protein CHS0354_011079 [Potamilus streckersoni]